MKKPRKEMRAEELKKLLYNRVVLLGCGHRFCLRVRQLNADRERLERALQLLRESGMPNYFGEQRFGRDYSNLAQVELLFEGRLRKIDRRLRGLLISAARS